MLLLETQSDKVDKEDNPAASENVGRRSVRGGTITLVSQLATAVLRIASIAILSRLLEPEAFGLVAMVMAVTTFASTFRDLGLSSATVQKAVLSGEQLSTLHWINVAAGAGLTLIVASISPMVTWFYGRPELTLVTIALAFTFVVESLGTQPGALLTRDMKFGRFAISDLAGSVTTFLMAACLACVEFGYWSLVWGNLGGVAVRAILLNRLCGWKAGRPMKNSGVGQLLGFGANVTAFNVVNYFARNLDNVLIGRFSGADSLGFYSRAYQLLMFPITNLRTPITRVAFPAMSRLKEDPIRYRNYYNKVVFGIAFLSMPLSAFLMVNADVVIEITLGQNWIDVTPIFRILSAVAFIQPTISTIGLVYLSLGRGGGYLKVGASCSFVYVIGFGIGILWDETGVAVSYVLSTYFGVVPITALAFRSTPVTNRDFIQALSQPALAGIIAGSISILFRNVFPPEASPWLVVISQSVEFATVYLLAFYLLPGGREQLRFSYAVLKSGIGIGQP